MLDFFGRVICPHCKANMQLKRIERSAWSTQAIFQCSSPKCFEPRAVTWTKPKSVVIERVA